MKKSLIIAGGLGNQMFQYAYCYVLRRLGYRVQLDTSLYRHVVMHYGYELPYVFGIKELTISGGRGHQIMLRIILKCKLPILLKEEVLGDIMPPPSPWVIFIKGEFQSELYFKEYESEIRSLFCFKSIDNNNRILAKELAKVNSVSIHIRRGDYVNNPIYSGICTRDYFMQAISIIKARVPNCIFYVFSNDTGWCKSFFDDLSDWIDYRIVDINSGEKSYQDLFLMSSCKHNIIVNSSFSWWGAWLNNNPDKVVIAPKKWANVDEYKYRFQVPNDWIKI